MEDQNSITQNDLVKSYHESLIQAVIFIENNLLGMLKGLLIYSKQDNAVIGIFYRIHILLKSLTKLNKSVDFNATAIMARTLFELVLDLKILTKDNIDKNILNRFYYFTEVKNYFAALKVKKFHTENQISMGSTFFSEEMREKFIASKSEALMKQKVKAIWGKTKKGNLKYPNNWTGEDIRNRAKSFGTICENEYLEIFKFLSSYIHSGNFMYSGLSKEQLQSVYGYTINYSRFKKKIS